MLLTCEAGGCIFYFWGYGGTGITPILLRLYKTGLLYSGLLFSRTDQPPPPPLTTITTPTPTPPPKKRWAGESPGGTPLRYVAPKRVWFLSCFGLKMVHSFSHFVPRLGMVLPSGRVLANHSFRLLIVRLVTRLLVLTVAKTKM